MVLEASIAPSASSHDDAYDRSGRNRTAPAAFGAYIGAAYFFTSSAGFAHPAITIGRIFSASFAGIDPAAVPGFIAAQLLGGGLAVALVKALYPAITAEQAARIIVPHPANGNTEPHPEADRTDAAISTPRGRPVR